MKKILITFFFCTFVFISPKEVKATPGDSCRTIGGQCKPYCDYRETNLGHYDCPAAYPDPQSICCKSTASGCKADNASCIEDLDCCSSSCKINKSGDKVCVENKLPTPIPTTAPTGKFDPTCTGQPQSINTAIGCIPAGDLNEFIAWLLGRVIFIASGIAFLLMAGGAIMYITSSGNPEKMKAGSELITSALSGLLFIIFSVFLLKLIGVDILQIPGFGQ